MLTNSREDDKTAQGDFAVALRQQNSLSSRLLSDRPKSILKNSIKKSGGWTHSTLDGWTLGFMGRLQE